MRRKRQKTEPQKHGANSERRDAEVQIIGGTFRGRRLEYHGDPVVRPMKHRTREAIFNLVSTECKGKHAIDLFAGTGALGLEALSRGASRATFIEKHVPSSRIIEQNIRTLDVDARATLIVTSAFLWAKRDLPNVNTIATGLETWLVFCSPPYAFYREREAEMLDLIQRIQNRAPAESILIVEAEEPFDFELLRGGRGPVAESGSWDVRAYAPAIIGIWRGGHNQNRIAAGKADSAREDASGGRPELYGRVSPRR